MTIQVFQYLYNPEANPRRSDVPLIIRCKGLTYYSQNYLKKALNNKFLAKMQNVHRISNDTWREINFKALNLHRQQSPFKSL